jgi:hypothetical protein
MQTISVTGKTHEVKSWPREFAAIREGIKTFEVRVDDRDEPYAVGDVLFQREWDPGSKSYTGQYRGDDEGAPVPLTLNGRAVRRARARAGPRDRSVKGTRRCIANGRRTDMARRSPRDSVWNRGGRPSDRRRRE